jgi:hypothetical protein
MQICATANSDVDSLILRLYLNDTCFGNLENDNILFLLTAY